MRIVMATSAIALIAGLGTAPALAQDQKQDKQLSVAACDTTWNAVDQNQDASISPEEARQASELEFQRLDADNDGSIDVEEFANCRLADMAALTGDRGGGSDIGSLTRTQPSIQSGEASQQQGKGDAADLTATQPRIQGQQDASGTAQPQQQAGAGEPQQQTGADRDGNQSDVADLTQTQPGMQQQRERSQGDVKDLTETQPQIQGQQQPSGEAADSTAPAQNQAGVDVPAPRTDIPKPDIARSDGDGDQTVSREEFIAGVRQHYQQNRQSFEGISEEQHARAAAFWFDRFDRDDSGDIDSEELASAEQLTQTGLGQADRDGDRMLSEEEWSAVEKGRESGSSPSSASAPAAGGQGEDKEGFAAMDSDNDGKLSPSEWMAGEERRRAELAFFGIDENKDGRISTEEWQARAEARLQEAQSRSAQPGAGEGPSVYRYYLFVY